MKFDKRDFFLVFPWMHLKFQLLPCTWLDALQKLGMRHETQRTQVKHFPIPIGTQAIVFSILRNFDSCPAPEPCKNEKEFRRLKMPVKRLKTPVRGLI